MTHIDSSLSCLKLRHSLLYDTLENSAHVGECLTLPDLATASTSTSLAPRMNLVITTGCSYSEQKQILSALLDWDLWKCDLPLDREQEIEVSLQGQKSALIFFTICL